MMVMNETFVLGIIFKEPYRENQINQPIFSLVYLSQDSSIQFNLTTIDVL